MKKLIIEGLIVFVFLIPQFVHSQGTTYLSNLSLSSAGSLAVGSDSWYAVFFHTGTNPNGYSLNSIQLAMTDASGNPNGFTVMVTEESIGGPAPIPGSNLGTLDGSGNPATAGIYTYTDDSNITLSPSTFYFIVLTAATTIANGDYGWSHAGAYSYNPIGGWTTYANVFNSSNGSSWTSASSGDAQFAVNATAIPEPSAWALALLGSGVFLYIRIRKPYAITTARKSQ